MSDKNLELLPCPFCGCEAELITNAPECFVRCLNDHCCPGRNLPETAIADWNTRADLAPSQPQAVGDEFQSRVKTWMLDCFGHEIAADKTERNHRFLEEALELVQSGGCTRSEAHQLVDYVYNRPTGEANQEVGGCMVTLAAWCIAHGLNMHDGGETELSRINQPEMKDKIRAKQAAKPKHSPLAEAVGEALGAINTLKAWMTANSQLDIVELKNAGVSAAEIAVMQTPVIERFRLLGVIEAALTTQSVVHFCDEECGGAINARHCTASDVGEAHTHKDFIVMPRKGHSELHEAMADACIRSIPQLESIYDSLPKEAANDFALELWNYMEPIYAAAIKEVDELHGYKYYSALNYTQSPDVGQLLKALKAKVNDALSMAETLGFYGELEKKALVAEYLITAIATLEHRRGK